MNEWLVVGPNGAHWFAAKNGDAACDAYRARFQLPMYALDQMCVVDVRKRA